MKMFTEDQVKEMLEQAWESGWSNSELLSNPKQSCEWCIESIIEGYSNEHHLVSDDQIS